MRSVLIAAALAISSNAGANDGYVQDSSGNVVRGSDGACWHTITWTPGKAIVGCDGKTAAPPAPKPRPVPLPPPPPPPPPPDADHDSVIDALDECPGTPAGMKVDVKGCVFDADHDGVADELDRCPDTPPGALVDENGCPKKLEQEVSISLDVNFANDSAVIQGDASGEIQKVVDFMKKYPNVNVTIEGYTDNRGGTQKNKKLSQRRADAVKDALIAGGIFGLRLTAVGYGAQNPIADNKTPEGRAQNRRVVAHAKAEVETVQTVETPE